MFELSLSLRFYIKYRRFAIRAERPLSSNTGLQYVQRKNYASLSIICYTHHSGNKLQYHMHLTEAHLYQFVSIIMMYREARK